jgi:hypothetical protein
MTWRVDPRPAPARAKPVPREKYEQANGVHLLRSLGATVYVLGTRRRQGDHPGTMQTPGIPDIYAFLPFDATRGWTARFVWWEVKAAGGRLRPEQAHFQTLCAIADVDHVAGDVNALVAYLIRRGRLKPESVAYYRQPAASAVTDPKVRP